MTKRNYGVVFKVRIWVIADSPEAACDLAQDRLPDILTSAIDAEEEPFEIVEGDEV